MATPTELSEFTTITTLPVQWGDMDAFGHVNNVVYFRWFESARIELLDHFNSDVTMETGGLGPILASIKCDYRRQLHFPDTIHVGSRVGRLGSTSAEIVHAVYSQKQSAIVAEGTSVIVIFDYAANRPVRIPEALRQRFQQTGE
ncbi:MAG: thioesterase family protein [Planctomycetaceae bacterium]